MNAPHHFHSRTLMKAVIVDNQNRTTRSSGMSGTRRGRRKQVIDAPVPEMGCLIVQKEMKKSRGAYWRSLRAMGQLREHLSSACCQSRSIAVQSPRDEWGTSLTRQHPRVQRLSSLQGSRSTPAFLQIRSRRRFNYIPVHATGEKL